MVQFLSKLRYSFQANCIKVGSFLCKKKKCEKFKKEKNLQYKWYLMAISK